MKPSVGDEAEIEWLKTRLALKRLLPKLMDTISCQLTLLQEAIIEESERMRKKEKDEGVKFLNEYFESLQMQHDAWVKVKDALKIIIKYFFEQKEFGEESFLIE